MNCHRRCSAAAAPSNSPTAARMSFTGTSDQTLTDGCRRRAASARRTGRGARTVRTSRTDAGRNVSRSLSCSTRCRAFDIATCCSPRRNARRGRSCVSGKALAAGPLPRPNQNRRLAPCRSRMQTISRRALAPVPSTQPPIQPGLAPCGS